MRRWTVRVALARKWPVVAVLLGALVALGIVGVIVYSGVELGRFDRAETRRATYIYAAGPAAQSRSQRPDQ